MNWSYPHFTEQEVACRCGCGMLPEPELMELLVKLREELGPISPSSVARCKKHNAAVSDTGETGPHTLGLAVDIPCYGSRAWHIVRVAFKLGFTGLGIRQKGEYSRRMIHLDCVAPSDIHPRPRIWTY